MAPTPKARFVKMREAETPCCKVMRELRNPIAQVACDFEGATIVVMSVSVNRLPIVELRQQLALVPSLSVVAADAILRLRPFADSADLRRKVNEAVAVPHECVGPMLVGHFYNNVYVHV